MSNKIDPIFFIIAQNMMKSVSSDKVALPAKKMIRNYIAEGLQNIATSLSTSYSMNDIARVELSILLPHGYYLDELDAEEDVVEILESVGVVTENTPGTQTAFQCQAVLNRFSGININE